MFVGRVPRATPAPDTHCSAPVAGAMIAGAVAVVDGGAPRMLIVAGTVLVVLVVASGSWAAYTLCVPPVGLLR